MESFLVAGGWGVKWRNPLGEAGVEGGGGVKVVPEKVSSQRVGHFEKTGERGLNGQCNHRGVRKWGKGKLRQFWQKPSILRHGYFRKTWAQVGKITTHVLKGGRNGVGRVMANPERVRSP